MAVDSARGDVPRERWLRRAVEAALGGFVLDRVVVNAPESGGAVEQALGSSAGYPSNSPAGPTAPAPERLLSSRCLGWKRFGGLRRSGRGLAPGRG